jgi:uncharacterized sulfatase
MLWADAMWGLRLMAAGMLLALCLGRWSMGVQKAVWAICGTVLWTFCLALEVYHEQAGVPLGADLWGYSWAEMTQTASAAGMSWPLAWWLAWLVTLLAWWGMLWSGAAWLLARRPPLWLGLGGVVLASWALPWQPGGASEGVDPHTGNKPVYFLSEMTRHALAANGRINAEVDQAYPFDRIESTPDTLGPLFRLDAKQPPHLMWVVVEGLGRSFSGPDARLGSFTPFLDELKDRSLYWDHFLATQGRTFAVLPSLLASLPFADHGAQPKSHHSLPAWLKSHGYVLRYFTGTQLDFDHQGDFLRSVGFETLFSEKDLAGKGTRVSEWGYPDGDVFDMVTSQPWPQQPSLTVVQTMSMHSPFQIPRQAQYREAARARMVDLGLTAEQKAQAERHLDVYATIMYTDEQLRLFYQRWQRMSQTRPTIWLITGDHRLPEIPMQTHLERFHVPLLLHSPILVEPVRIKAVSTHFDVAPAMQAMMSRQYGWPTPQRVHWMGSGLDVDRTFRNLHAVPLKQTKTELVDYVSGEYVLHRDQLLSLRDGLLTEPEHAPEVRAQLRQSLSGFQARLDRALRQEAWVENPEAVTRLPYQSTSRDLIQGQKLALYRGLSVRDLRVDSTPADSIQARAVFTHSGDKTSDFFVPLLVITNQAGQQVAERSGQALRLQPGESVEVELSMARPPGSGLFVSFVVSNPDNGKSMGRGQYHVALRP